MSVEGRISVDVLFHDKDGTSAINVVSLAKVEDYSSGKVAVVTGTAGEDAVQFSAYGDTPFRDSTGSLVSFNAATRLVFTWSGSYDRQLDDISDGQFSMRSRNGWPAMTSLPAFYFEPLMSGGGGTGTYTILIYGED